MQTFRKQTVYILIKYPRVLITRGDNYYIQTNTLRDVLIRTILKAMEMLFVGINDFPDFHINLFLWASRSFIPLTNHLRWGPVKIPKNGR